jgi:hypothetical protein
MHITAHADTPSVFEKFGGIRPMASKVGRPPSTVKSWHAKREIPEWHRDRILKAAALHRIPLTLDELVNIRPDTASTKPTPSEAA